MPLAGGVSLMLWPAIQCLSLFLMSEIMHIRQYLPFHKLSLFSGCLLMQARQEVSFISQKKSSSKSNRFNWSGYLACVPEQKWAGSRSAARLEGRHQCSSSESITSWLGPERALALGVPVSTVGLGERQGIQPPVDHAEQNWPCCPCGQHCSEPLWEAGTFSLCGCFKAGLDKQQTMLRTCSDGQDGKGAWSILVNTYVPFKSRLLWWISSHVTFVSLVSAQLLHILPFPNILHSFTSQP